MLRNSKVRVKSGRTYKDECRKGDGDDGEKSRIDRPQTQHDDARALHNGLPHPNKEAEQIHSASVPSVTVQDGEVHHLAELDVFVQNQREDREVGEDRRVAHDQVPVVDVDRDVVVQRDEDDLDGRDD